MVLTRSAGGRTWIQGRTILLRDVHNFQARELYNQNWDGCRDLWKERYRHRMSLRGQRVPPKEPKQIEYELEQRRWWQAEADKFNRQQQERYERWLKENKPD